MADSGLCFQLLCTNLGDVILCTLLPNCNIHGCLQQWTKYALKPKSVSKKHFCGNSKKTQSLGKNGCRQKCLDKSLPPPPHFLKSPIPPPYQHIDNPKFSLLAEMQLQ